MVNIPPYPDPAAYWHRTDRPILDGIVARSFFWGPQSWLITREPYREAPFGTRRVIYYDKARMEVTNPSVALVTNGLLVVELATGRRQLGDNTFESFAPAQEAVAGDPIAVNPNAPTYASFGPVVSLQPGRDPQRLGQLVSATLDRASTIGENRALARPETKIVAYDSVTGHNIPRVFHDFMHQRGPVYELATAWAPGQPVTRQVMDPLIAMGRPITEPYWVRARVNGVEKWVLTQLFERRVLTYTPDNPAGWRVEMGNVGQHYFAWRYGERPWETAQ